MVIGRISDSVTVVNIIDSMNTGKSTHSISIANVGDIIYTGNESKVHGIMNTGTSTKGLTKLQVT